MYMLMHSHVYIYIYIYMYIYTHTHTQSSRLSAKRCELSSLPRFPESLGQVKGFLGLVTFRASGLTGLGLRLSGV